MLIRREFSMVVDDEAEGQRLNGLVDHHFVAIRREMHLGLSSCPTIRATTDEYIRYQRVVRANSKGRLVYIRRVLERFASELSSGAGDVAIDCITSEQVAGWMDRRLDVVGNRSYSGRVTVEPATVNNETGVLKQYARWMVGIKRAVRRADIDVLDVPRCADKNRLDDNRLPPRVITASEHADILGAMCEHGYQDVAAVWYMMPLVSARPSVLLGLRWRDVHKADGGGLGRIDLPGQKGGRAVAVLYEAGDMVSIGLDWARRIGVQRWGRMSKRRQVFASLCGRNGWWTNSTYGHKLRRVLNEIGVAEPVTIYWLRACSATWASEAGASAFDIMDMMSHRRVSTQDVYRRGSGVGAAGARGVVSRRMAAAVVSMGRWENVPEQLRRAAVVGMA